MARIGPSCFLDGSNLLVLAWFGTCVFTMIVAEIIEFGTKSLSGGLGCGNVPESGF